VEVQERYERLEEKGDTEFEDGIANRAIREGWTE
jgi:hypothetical protein